MMGLRIFVSPNESASLLTMLARQSGEAIEVLPDNRHLRDRRKPFRGMLSKDRRTPRGRDPYGVVQFEERRGRARLSCSAQIVVTA